MAEPTCKCIMSAHCNPRRGDCKLKAGGTINAGGGVCAPAAMPERIFVRRDDEELRDDKFNEGCDECEARRESTEEDNSLLRGRVLDLEAELRDRHGALHELQRALSGQYIGAQVVAALAVAAEILNGLDEDERRFLVVEKSFRGLVAVARAILDETYPPDIFVGGGEGTDPGVAFVVALREALAHVKPGEALEGGTTHDG